MTEVDRLVGAAGDVVDFVVSPNANSNSDSHAWVVQIDGIEGDLIGQAWNSQRDFASPPPPPLEPLAQLAQALLLTNEFLYLD